MKFDPTRPLVVQNDFTVLVETHHPDFEAVRTQLSQFADLLKSPEHLHTYKITPLSVWNAAASGMKLEEITSFLQQKAKFGLPTAVLGGIRKYVYRYGVLRLESVGNELHLVSDDTVILKEIIGRESLSSYLREAKGERAISISQEHRGLLKQELIKMGYPVDDMAVYRSGEHVPIDFRQETFEAEPFQLRDYQRSAVEAFRCTEAAGRGASGGSGVLVLPCGAGKTIIGIGAMEAYNCATLILTTNVTSVKQWKREILSKTSLTEEQVGEYTGACKEVKPVTIATYQILTHRANKEDEFSHMQIFHQREWGLIIYDEVHLLPAPVFRATADIQATRRLGLTATLIREDGREEDVFSLIGPKRYEIGWKELESSGYIAKVACIELRVPLEDKAREDYAFSDAKRQFRIAGENIVKLDVIDALLKQHEQEQVLIIGQYLDQLERISQRTGAPVINGEMPQEQRDILYQKFKDSSVSVLIVSKVANFAVDLPDASVAIQVSGSFGSRQEEAQRLGRVLRPKKGTNSAVFYSIVSRDTKEQDFSLKRQLFLVQQGYQYAWLDWEHWQQSTETGGHHEVRAGV
ncbi:DNA repair helicase XPB [Paenibacillus hexagrammi]|uniref:DNA 3'-5' helicase n=1 Tax=Paenibacillus hexagrammi TaxID=2908839 RepID=A0ABY3SMU4_9BACL|nr:DNA repair helicase XPB [Paenibacillus sp. YPD9-1]UJF35261.1 DEAD/DEAH box helicase [Paenibacillus sp. YPD9-1]